MICGIIALLLVVWRLIFLATRFPERTVRDVYPFFRYVESEVLTGTFHPDPEAEFRASHSTAEFKKWQQKRIHLALHLCRDITSNCRLLISWASFERHVHWSDVPDELKEGLRTFQLSAQHARTASFAIRFRLRFRLIRMTLLPFLPIPSFTTLVEHSNALIEFYGKAERLAEVLSHAYGEDVYLNMSGVLGMVDWN